MSGLFHLLFLLITFLPCSLVAEPVEGEKTWGVYQIHRGVERFEAGLVSQVKLLGAVPDYVLFFRDMNPGRGFPAQTAEVCKKYGATAVISQELWRWSERSEMNRTWLARINAGETDEFWREWGRGAKAFDSEVVLRFGFEMNGDWFGWGQQPEAFIKAWRRVHGIIRGEGATKVQFMFSPNVEWDESKEKAAIELYYPGDEFVDFLGLDGYNFGDDHSEWHSWQSYEAVFEKSIRKMSQADKPLILSEIGCADGPLKGEWMKGFLDSVEKDGRVSGFIYYNHFDPRKREPNWLLNSDPGALKMFREFIQRVGE
ncbi:MAG: glycoside hydrolase family 26 protein [Akkermansiaceae bacterium]